MVKFTRASNKSKGNKNILHKKNDSKSIKKTSNLAINRKTKTNTAITQKLLYDSPIQLIKRSQKYQAKRAKQSPKSNCNAVPTSSLSDSVIILSDNENEKNETPKPTAINNVGDENASLGKIFKSFHNLRKASQNIISNKIAAAKRKNNITERSSFDKSCVIASNAPSSNALNETIDDVVVVWSSLNKSPTDESALHDADTDEYNLDDEEQPRLFMFDYEGDANNLKFLKSNSNDQNVNCQEETKENNNDLLFNKRGLKLPYGNKSSFPINVQPQKNIRRISAKFYNKKSNSSNAKTSNAVTPNAVTQNEPGKLREIIIDGCNVGMAYTHGKSFSELGLKLVIDYFKNRGHTVKAFVPQHKRSLSKPLLEKLYKQGIVVFTPSRNIGGKSITPYDDRYILQYASLCKGIVVSLDQYRDLYDEKPEWRDTIEKRLLAPTFVGDVIMFPDDPLGRDGPSLDEFLRHDS